MPFFPVDDQFAFQQKALLAGNAAIGVWTRAGAECMRTASGGVVLRELGVSLGTPAQIKRLVEVNLWHAAGHKCKRCPQPPKGGWVFHDWEDIGTVKTAEQILARRKSDRERQREWRARNKDVMSHGVTDRVTDAVTNGVSHEVGRGVSHATPVPVPSVVKSVSQSPSLTRVIRLTDEDIAKIQKRLDCDQGHAERVADRILDKAAATVARPGRYVLAAIEAEPGLYRQAKRNTAADQCPTHPGNPKPPNCGGCNADARAVK